MEADLTANLKQGSPYPHTSESSLCQKEFIRHPLPGEREVQTDPAAMDNVSVLVLPGKDQFNRQELQCCTVHSLRGAAMDDNGLL